MFHPDDHRFHRWGQSLVYLLACTVMLLACEGLPLESSPCPCLREWNCCGNQCVKATDCPTTRHIDSGADLGGDVPNDVGSDALTDGAGEIIVINGCQGYFFRRENPGDVTSEVPSEWLAVSGCIPGTVPPVQALYDEQSHEYVARELRVEGHHCPATWWSAEGYGVASRLFDLDVSGIDSSTTMQGTAGVQVLPGEYAVWYRRKIHVTRTALAFRSGAPPELVGKLDLHTSRWEISARKWKSPTCPPLPPPPDR